MSLLLPLVVVVLRWNCVILTVSPNVHYLKYEQPRLLPGVSWRHGLVLKGIEVYIHPRYISFKNATIVDREKMIQTDRWLLMVSEPITVFMLYRSSVLFIVLAINYFKIYINNSIVLAKRCIHPDCDIRLASPPPIVNNNNPKTQLGLQPHSITSTLSSQIV